jgi:hypothetical protein
MDNKDLPAHPLSTCEAGNLDEEVTTTYLGLTKREYFAAMALQGLLANSSALDAIRYATLKGFEGLKVADIAVLHANDLLKALEK